MRVEILAKDFGRDCEVFITKAVNGAYYYASPGPAGLEWIRQVHEEEVKPFFSCLAREAKEIAKAINSQLDPQSPNLNKLLKEGEALARTYKDLPGREETGGIQKDLVAELDHLSPMVKKARKLSVAFSDFCKVNKFPRNTVIDGVSFDADHLIRRHAARIGDEGYMRGRTAAKDAIKQILRLE